jgi:hypothetical protein
MVADVRYCQSDGSVVFSEMAALVSIIADATSPLLALLCTAVFSNWP